MEKIRNSDFLKIICYIAIPILVLLLILSIFHIEYLNKFETKYSQTEDFSNKYLRFFINKIVECQNADKNGLFIELEDEQENKYYYQSSQYL